MNVRDIVYKIIYDVKYKKKYSNILINNFFNNNTTNNSEKNYITYVCYGVLSNINYLDYFIKKYSDIAFSKISKQARVILEIAFFELVFMNSSNDYSTVNECVLLCKKYDYRAKNFVNAILRKVSVKVNIDCIKKYKFDDINDDILRLSTKYSISSYISKRLINNYGYKFTEELMIDMSKIPPVYIRGNRLKTTFNKLKYEIDKLDLEYKLIDEENMIFLIYGFKNISNTKIYKEGCISLQDYSSMLCCLSLGVKENENILDICSAPGGKSIFIAELMNNKGNVKSLDISKNKLNLLQEQVKRLGIDIIDTDVNDATILNEKYIEKFDRVLADVPCSGIGILRRKPEIRYKEKDDIESIFISQKLILENASKYVKEGGVLVYSTCTLGREENDDVVKKFVENNLNFKIVSKKEFYPHKDNTDGFFVCVMNKVSL